MQLIVLSPPEFRPHEPELVCRMFEAGLEYYHLRKPEFTLAQTEAYLKAIPREFHPHIVLHYQFGLLQSFGLKGIHFNSANVLNISDYFALGGLRSFSPSDLDDLLPLYRKIDYAFLRPVFTRGTLQQGSDEHSTLAFYLARHAGPRLVAMGLGPNCTLHAIQRLGYWGVAVQHELWQSSLTAQDVLSRLKHLLQTLGAQTEPQ